jgi:hypothetical protein
MSILGGLGYVVGAVHVYQALEPARPLLRRLITAGVLITVLVAIATHAVWGAFALTLAAGEPGAEALVRGYLSTHFVIGQLIGLPTAMLLLTVTLLGETRWPRWTAVLNPGVLYLVFTTAAWFPAPLGAAIVGGAFNLAFALFFAASLALRLKRLA